MRRIRILKSFYFIWQQLLLPQIAFMFLFILISYSQFALSLGDVRRVSASRVRAY